MGGGEQNENGRRYAVSDFALKTFSDRFGNLSKEDIFFYVYGILHNADYREKFKNNLKKALPRIPLVEREEQFIAYEKAGRALAELHLNYDNDKVPLYDKCEIVRNGIEESEDYYNISKISKMKLDKEKCELTFNNNITIKNIPKDAFDYFLAARSPLEHIVNNYQYKEDKETGIVNDPNDYSKEIGDRKYIFNLILRAITLSLESNKIIKSLPKIDI